MKKENNLSEEKKFDTKAEMMWKISKEQEQNFKYAILEKYPSNIVEEIDIDDLFKLIRGAEYRRGKEDVSQEYEKYLEDYKKGQRELIAQEFIKIIDDWAEKYGLNKLHYKEQIEELTKKIINHSLGRTHSQQDVSTRKDEKQEYQLGKTTPVDTQNYKNSQKGRKGK